jgi:hypothetical protein
VAIARRPGAGFVTGALLAKEKSKSLRLRKSQSAGVKVPLGTGKRLVNSKDALPNLVEINCLFDPITVSLASYLKWTVVPLKTKIRKGICKLKSAGRESIG